MIDILNISYKWKSYRDSVKRFFLIDKEKGEQNYIERMKYLQSIIKEYAKKNNTENINAVIDISDKLDGMMALQTLAAGYELCSGNDLTK